MLNDRIDTMLDHGSQQSAEASQALRVAVDATTAETASSWYFASSILLRRIGRVYSVMASACAQAADPQKEAQREIVVVALARSRAPPKEHSYARGGPVIAAERAADDYFVVDEDGGDGLFRYFMDAMPHRASDAKAPIPVSMLPDAAPAGTDPSRKHYLTIAVGGTFDHLHLGHRLLLTAVTLLAASRDGPDDGRRRRFIVGITGDELLKKKKFAEALEAWEQRQQAVARFVNSIANLGRPFESVPRTEFSNPGPNGHAVHYEFQDNVVLECVEIADPFGPTITDEAIDALVVSGETRSGGQAVNEKRRGLGWRELDVVEVDVLDANAGKDAKDTAANFGSKISSTAIRESLARKAVHGHG